MRSELRAVVVALIAGAGLGVTGCTEMEDGMARVATLNFMREAPFFDPYEAPRPAPVNSVPVDGPSEKWEPAVEKTEVGLRAWGDTLTNPLAMDEAVITRGAEVYATYCSVCHGVSAQGDGPIVGPGKFPLATNLTLPTTVERTDGYIYAIVRVGRGLMPSYQRITPAERWAVVNYVRYLQRGGAPIRVELPGVVQPGVDAFNTTQPQGGAADGAADTGGQE